MQNKRQAYNPYLPSFEYIPDGEPHVFGDRLYLYGSHDRFNGAGFCLNDYVCWSAPVDDVTNWHYEGVIFRKEQDPRNQNIPEDTPPAQPYKGIELHDQSCLNGPGIHAMWAPDVVHGADGRYYLYYCLDWLDGIGVAVCNSPAGKYEFLGFVRHKDGSILGLREGDLQTFDPGIFVDDDGEVYLYSGNCSRNRNDTRGRHHSQVMTLESDMLTLKTEPRDLIPAIYESEGSAFDGHEFFEASSIRKIGARYYFVYSSVQSHELNYAVSDRPDGGYAYGGTLVDIGDVFLDGRTEDGAVNALGNTHGGIECVNGKWYVFYHRQTNRTNFSRQACAEKITIDRNGFIKQAEVTSCGLNPTPLRGTGIYPAYIACHVTRGGKNVMSMPSFMGDFYPYFTQDMPDAEPDAALIDSDSKDPVMYLANIRNGAKVGFKYFNGVASVLRLTVRGKAAGRITLSDGKHEIGKIQFTLDSDSWTELDGAISAKDDVHPLYISFDTDGTLDFKKMQLS